jgi:hypothetical protein
MNTIHNVVEKKTIDTDKLASSQCLLSIARTDGKKGKSGLCIIADTPSQNWIQLLEHNAIGNKWITGKINELRSEIASSINKAGGTIYSSNIGYEAIVAEMGKVTESSAFTVASIETWFNTYMKPLIVARLAEKGNISSSNIEKMASGYLKSFQILAARKDNRYMSSSIKASLVKALSLLPDDHDTTVCNEISERLECITEAPELDLCAL